MNGPTQSYIDKLAAARRQLLVAVRLFFQDEDPLAVHTLASAAYRLIIDLQGAGGEDEASNVVYGELLHLVELFRKNELPNSVLRKSDLVTNIASVSERLPPKLPATPTQLGLALSEEEARRYWRQHNYIANFLKHADSDPSAILDIRAIDNLQLLMQATASFGSLAGELRENEFLVLAYYFGATRMGGDLVPLAMRESSEFLESLDPELRLRKASQLLAELGASRKLLAIHRTDGDE